MDKAVEEPCEFHRQQAEEGLDKCVKCGMDLTIYKPPKQSRHNTIHEYLANNPTYGMA